MEKIKSDKTIKAIATKKEYNRVYNNYNLPPQDIIVQCNDGTWRRKAWQALNKFGWKKWEKID